METTLNYRIKEVIDEDGSSKFHPQRQQIQFTGKDYHWYTYVREVEGTTGCLEKDTFDSYKEAFELIKEKRSLDPLKPKKTDDKVVIHTLAEKDFC